MEEVGGMDIDFCWVQACLSRFYPLRYDYDGMNYDVIAVVMQALKICCHNNLSPTSGKAATCFMKSGKIWTSTRVLQGSI